MSYTGTGAFLDDLRIICNTHNVTLKLVQAKTVEIEEGIRCTGYFDGGNAELAVAKRRGNWLELLVHESCHLDQWVEQTKEWRDEDIYGNNRIDKWLLGKEVEGLRKSINNTIALELDCEKRAVKKMVEYDLPINTITYIQKANAYIQYYNYVYLTRRWCAQFGDKAVHTEMPSKFMPISYYRKLPLRIQQIFQVAGL